MTTGTPYSKRFYDGLAQGSLDSARVYLGHLFAVWMPASVVDLGCGRGAWLAAAGERGVRRLVGVDGAWNAGDTLREAAIQFHSADLDQEVRLAERFDLALSLEVAEHIRPESSQNFVASLARLADAVVFSAAFVGQSGTGHINTRPHNYWARKFMERGFALFDFFRPHFWSDDRVEPWYRQNTFLYVRSEHPLYGALMARGHRPSADARFVDAIHPWLYEKVLREMFLLRDAASNRADPAAAPTAAPVSPAAPTPAPVSPPAPPQAATPAAAPSPDPTAARASPQTAASASPPASTPPKPKLKLELKPAPAPEPARSTVSRQHVGRNDPCPCGSGRRFKHCHGRTA